MREGKLLPSPRVGMGTIASIDVLDREEGAISGEEQGGSGGQRHECLWHYNDVVFGEWADRADADGWVRFLGKV